MLIEQCLAGPEDVFCLGLIEATGLDGLFQFWQTELQHLGCRGRQVKQGWGDHIDPLVSALGGEDGGDQKLEITFMVQGALGLGIEAPKFF